MNWVTSITNHNMDRTNYAYLKALCFKNMTNHMCRSRLTICSRNTNHTHTISRVIKEIWNTRHHSLTCISNSNHTYTIRYSYRFRNNYRDSTSSNCFINIIMTIYCSPIQSNKQAVRFYRSRISCNILNRYILISFYVLYIYCTNNIF